jgi:hypothetical protein
LTLRPLFPIMCTCTSCIALWPAGIIEIVNVARTIWKVEEPWPRPLILKSFFRDPQSLRYIPLATAIISLSVQHHLLIHRLLAIVLRVHDPPQGSRDPGFRYPWLRQTEKKLWKRVRQFHPFYRPRRPLGRVEVALLCFYTSALERGEESASHPDRFLPQGKTPYPLYRRLGWPQGRSGQVRKISPPPGFDPRTVQPLASRYTDL